MKKLAVAALALLIAGPAMAQSKKIGGPVGQVLDHLQGTNESSLTGGGGNVTLCDATLMSNLQIKNLIQQIKVCKAADAQAALASATTAKDDVAISCLTPVVALFQALEGATPATPTTTPATATAPATTETVLIPAGPLLLFQKFREFATSGGISHCRAWVTTTIAQGSLIQ